MLGMEINLEKNTICKKKHVCLEKKEKWPELR